jgi:hypothetical protein
VETKKIEKMFAEGARRKDPKLMMVAMVATVSEIHGIVDADIKEAAVAGKEPSKPMKEIDYLLDRMLTAMVTWSGEDDPPVIILPGGEMPEA